MRLKLLERSEQKSLVVINPDLPVLRSTAKDESGASASGVAHCVRSDRLVPRTVGVVPIIKYKRLRDVAQSGQRASFGTKKPAVRIRPSRFLKFYVGIAPTIEFFK